MTAEDLVAALARGEDTQQQFKRDIQNPDALATELAAFANGQGGRLYIGVDDDGKPSSLSIQNIKKLNALLSNAASDRVEITSPGCLPDHSNIAQLRYGTRLRNPLLAGHAFHILPDQGLGRLSENL